VAEGAIDGLCVTKDGVTVVGPLSRNSLAEPTNVGACPSAYAGVACDCAVGSASSCAAAKTINRTESIVDDLAIILTIFIGFKHTRSSVNLAQRI